MVAEFELSELICGRLVSIVRLPTVTVGPPVLPQLFANEVSQPLPPPQAARASAASAENHRSLRILIT
jgi:hypothetical protein